MNSNFSDNFNKYSLPLKRFIRRKFPSIYFFLKNIMNLIRRTKSVITRPDLDREARVASQSHGRKKSIITCPDLDFKYASSKLCKIDAEKIEVGGAEKKLFYIDRANDREAFVFANNIVGNSNVYLLFKAKIDYQKFKDQLQVEEHLDRVFFVPGIDYDIDDDIYAIAHDFAVELLELAQGSFMEYDFSPSFAESITALNLGVTDRLQAWIRNAFFVKKLITLQGIEKFYFLSTAGSQLDLIALFVKEQLGIPTKVITIFGEIGNFNARELIGNNWSLPDKSIVSRYSMNNSLPEGEDFIIYFGNLKDPLYRGTADAVLRKLSKSIGSSVIVLQSDAIKADIDVPRTIFLRPSIELYQSEKLSDFKLCFDDLCKKFINNGLKDFDGGILRTYSLANSRRTLYKLFLDCFVIKSDLDELLSKNNLKGLVSNPGRLWMSQYINMYLKDTPSFEIQSGTLSKTLRYRPPHSKFILAVDDFSKEVYCDYLGVDDSRVHVVGAPRIDEKLSEIREVSAGASRKYMCLPSKGELTCIATQPYGVELMASMVEQVANLLEANQEHFLVVSMHPNETSEYEAAYRKVLRIFLDSGQAYISRGEIYHCMNAADNVVTFFSTSGIEAFCLKKRVFSFRPLDLESIPFDLCKLGVALPFTDSKELLRHLEGDVAARPSTIGLQNLQDGQSVSRICSFIEAHI